jgi:Fe-S cluster assembly protein SufD
MEVRNYPMIDFHEVANEDLLLTLMNGTSVSATASVRKEAMELFKTLPYPDKNNEEFKYTNIDALMKDNAYTLHTNPKKNLLGLEEIKAKLSLTVEANYILIINGFISEIEAIDDNIQLTSLKSFLSYDGHPAESIFGNVLPIGFHSLVALNTALAQQGSVFIVPEDTKLTYPVITIRYNDNQSDGYFTNTRNLWIVSNNATAEFYDVAFDNSTSNYFTNHVNEIVVEDGGKLHFGIFQNLGASASMMATTQVNIMKGAEAYVTTLSTGGKLIRNDLNFALLGSHSSAYLNGLYLANGDNHIDNHTFVDHAVPNCYSNELYKGIMSGSSTGVFNGKILVRPDAQKTNAFQTNKNVLLSKDAKIDTKPQLEIFADDVKCSHGATIGKLDEDALFYLQSRGISKPIAYKLLLNSFATATTDLLSQTSMNDFAQQFVKEAIEKL